MVIFVCYVMKFNNENLSAAVSVSAHIVSKIIPNNQR